MERWWATGFQLRWSTEVLVAVLLLLLGSVPAAWTQSGFLNIDCGAPSSYVDSATGLTWEPDAPYISSGKTQTLRLPTSLQSFTEAQTLRYFDDTRAKNCYALPVTHNTSYHLKLTFFYGNYDNANLPPKFQVAIDANIISNVTVDTAALSSREYHYLSRGNFTFVCLIRTSPGATPFISGISLKLAASLVPENVTPYTVALQEGKIMRVLNRVNFGGTALIRAPTDYYDRFWIPEGLSSVYYLTPQISGYEFLSTSSVIQVPNSWPPSAVLQTAVTSSGAMRSYIFPEDSPAYSSAYIVFYFAQLDNSSSPPLRNFTVSVTYLYTVVDMAAYKFLDYHSWYFPLEDRLLYSNTTVLLHPLSTDEAGPIMNCMEVFSKSEDRRVLTGTRDAVAIEDIKKSFNLTEWTGDPCLPFPHAWLSCSIPDLNSSNPEPFITAMNLSGYRLEGVLPLSFANLRDLTSLDLSNNGFNGSLPVWLTTFAALKLLAVQNNNFSGPIPQGLRSSNLQTFTYYGNPLLVDQPAPAPECSNCNKSNIAVIAGASAGGVVGLALITVIAILAFRRCKRKPKLSDDQRRASIRMVTPNCAKSYTFAEVTGFTSQFDRLLGRGGFGPVYYGKLPDGQEVAVKVADGDSKHGEAAFFTEVDVLSRVHHKNLVELVGYCQEQKQILIYEYMPNGSLFDHLHGTLASNGILDWKMRLRIAVNAAQGLDYLHTACKPSFIHRDVKSSNILLTPEFEAKVADFGVTKQMAEVAATGVMTNNVVGTAGYMDPEYHRTQYISSKSDVYSFGIVLLELLTGGLPIENLSRTKSNQQIDNWVRESLQGGNITSILDPVVTTSNPNMDGIWKVAEIAMQSVEPKGIYRPTMTKVVQELQDALAIEDEAPSFNSSGILEYTIGLQGPTSSPTSLLHGMKSI